MSYDILRSTGKVVSFDTIPTAILPLKYTAVEVVGLVGYHIAISVEDVTAKYQQMIPYIEGISTDFTKAEYVIVKHNSGALEVLAMDWIVESTISSSTIANKRVTLYDVDSTANIKITRALAMLGYKNFKIEDI